MNSQIQGVIQHIKLSQNGLKISNVSFFRVLRDDSDCVCLAIKKEIGVGHTSKDTMGSHFEIRAHTPSIWQVCMDALINY